MRCMTKKTTHGDKDPNPRNKYNLTPETTRVGVQIGKVTSGVLHNDTEFKDTGLDTYLDTLGITHEFSAPYTPH